MKYDLAKRLKDAGFPIKKLCLCEGSPCPHLNFPTLSELIEACGGNAKVLMNKGDGTGWAYAVDGIGKHGSTPEEAVANLWLELNKK